MIQDLLSRLFKEPESEPRLNTDDAEMAIAALLVRVARADGQYEEVERAQIDQILTHHFSKSAKDATELRAAAEMIEAEAPDTVRFTRRIKECVALEDRNAIIASMWKTALADTSRGAEEDATIRLVAGLLGISDQDSGLIRQQITRTIGPE